MRCDRSSAFAELVRAAGTSLDELADLTGLTMATMLRLAGGGLPGEDSAIRLAAVLSIEPADVVDPTSWLAREPRRAAQRRARLARAMSVPPTGRRDWRDLAACRWADPEAFWPGVGEQPEAALALCAACPVLGDCRQAFEASPLPEAGGVWFGTSANDRREHRQLIAATHRNVA